MGTPLYCGTRTSLISFIVFSRKQNHPRIIWDGSVLTPFDYFKI